MSSFSADPLQVRRVHALPAAIHGLANRATREGHDHIARLVMEFAANTNRFQQHGEALFVGLTGDAVIAVGGLNVDPYTPALRVGRVRRVYVHPAHRRCGIASVLMQHIENHAQRHFPSLQLFTSAPAAAKFYASLGYVRVFDQPKVSHAKDLSHATKSQTSGAIA